MYGILDKLGGKILYYDTESIFYVDDVSKPIPHDVYYANRLMNLERIRIFRSFCPQVLKVIHIKLIIVLAIRLKFANTPAKLKALHSIIRIHRHLTIIRWGKLSLGTKNMFKSNILIHTGTRKQKTY